MAAFRYGDIAKGMRKSLRRKRGWQDTKEYSIPRGVHINVQEGDHVKAGEALIDGPLNLHDLLAVLGEKFTQSARLEDVINSLPAKILTERLNGKWSIQEHAGHFADLEELHQGRWMIFYQERKRFALPICQIRKPMKLIIIQNKFRKF